MKCSVNACRLCPTVRTHASVPSSVAWFDVTCDSDHASAHCVDMSSQCACVRAAWRRIKHVSKHAAQLECADGCGCNHCWAFLHVCTHDCWRRSLLGYEYSRLGKASPSHMCCVCVCVHDVWSTRSSHEESCTVHVCCCCER